VGIWSSTLFAGVGVGLAPIAAIGVALVWLVVGLWLGGEQKKREAAATQAG
jgi:hypothetical protein